MCKVKQRNEAKIVKHASIYFTHGTSYLGEQGPGQEKVLVALHGFVSVTLMVSASKCQISSPEKETERDKGNLWIRAWTGLDGEGERKVAAQLAASCERGRGWLRDLS